MSALSELERLILGRTAPAAVKAILAAGYRKPRVLGYAVVDRAGAAVHTFKNRTTAQQVAEESTRDCKEAGIDWDYRVADIVEAGQ
jgi:hypothetical protein